MSVSDLQARVPASTNDGDEANSKSTLTLRAASGLLTWTGPLLVIMGRSVLIIGAQALVACLYWLRMRSWSWNAAAKWWTVYGTLVDAGCLALMAVYTRREGIRLGDLIGGVRLRRGRDLFAGAGCFLAVFLFFFFAAPLASWLVYRSVQPPSFAGMLTGRVLLLWGMIYSFSVWWLVWSPTEEMTYQGYALPRIEALSGSRWKAIAIVSFWWTLQHCFLPFILDWRYVAWRFFSFLPGVVVFTLIYLRIRRLPPLILAHWSMDIVALFFTLNF
jgi:uncharacterized protein